MVTSSAGQTPDQAAIGAAIWDATGDATGDAIWDATGAVGQSAREGRFSFYDAKANINILLIGLYIGASNAF